MAPMATLHKGSHSVWLILLECSIALTCVKKCSQLDPTNSATHNQLEEASTNRPLIHFASFSSSSRVRKRIGRFLSRTQQQKNLNLTFSGLKVNTELNFPKKWRKLDECVQVLFIVLLNSIPLSGQQVNSLIKCETFSTIIPTNFVPLLN